MYLSVTSVSTRAGEAPDTDESDEANRPPASGPLEAGGEAARSGPSGNPGATASDGPTRDGSSDDSTGGNGSVRTRLVESTVVAVITGVFVVLGGSAHVAPRLTLPVALAGVLWLFVRTLPSMRRIRSNDAAEDDATDAGEDATNVADGGTPAPRPASRPVSTDRRLKMEVAEHGGQMMQKELVEAVDLSESAVSRRLSSLEESDTVGRVCLGRENLVYLEGSRPEGADSPFAER